MGIYKNKYTKQKFCPILFFLSKFFFLSISLQRVHVCVCVCVTGWWRGVFFSSVWRMWYMNNRFSREGRIFSLCFISLFTFSFVFFLRAPTAIWKRQKKKMDTNKEIGGVQFLGLSWLQRNLNYHTHFHFKKKEKKLSYSPARECTHTHFWLHSI